MCGIFGFCYTSSSGISLDEAHRMMDHLFLYSQSRGKEASGVFADNGSSTIILKDTQTGSRFIKRQDYRKLFAGERPAVATRSVMLGHARLDTQGSKWDNNNNSPLEYESVYGIHNGIIVNVEALWKQHPDLKRYREVDSEILLALFYDKLDDGFAENKVLLEILASIEGSASVALFSKMRGTLSLATNTGSLYFIQYKQGLFVFASECYILEQFHHKLGFLKKMGGGHMQQILPGTAAVVRAETAELAYPYTGRIVHALL